MAYGHHYVDPSLDSNTGNGLIGSPYGDLQYCFNQMTRNTDGDRINIKSGSAEVLVAPLDLTNYGTGGWAAPIDLFGYDAAEGDGGIGEVDCNLNTMFAAAPGYVQLHNLAIHNSGSNHIVHLGAGCAVRDCEVYNTGVGAFDGVRLNTYGSVKDCNIHNIGGYGVYIFTYTNVMGNYIWHDTKTMAAAIWMGDGSTLAYNNIITLDGESLGIYATGNNVEIHSNSVLQLTTGTGLLIDPSTLGGGIWNNVVEGGATGIDVPVISLNQGIMYNAAYNNTTDYNFDAIPPPYIPGNESLSESGFAKSGANTFANRFTYFAPVDTGEMANGGWPYGSNNSKGAVQFASSGGGEHSHVFAG